MKVDRVSAPRLLLLSVTALVVTALVLTAASTPAVADAAETVIGFDDQPTGTMIGNQYAGLGVTFDVKPSGAADSLD